MTLSECASCLWGKSDREKKDGLWHALVHHLLDVAACAEAILEREPQSTRELYTKDLGFSGYASAKSWLLSLIALHDLGKASPSFQVMWPSGAERVRAAGLTFEKEHTYIPHGVLGQVALCEAQPLTFQLSYDLLRLAADAVGSHHGRRASPSDLDISDKELGKGAWEEVREELILAVLELFGAEAADAPTLESLGAAAFHRLAGLTSFADWIGSSQSFFTFESEVGDLADYYQRSLAKAEAALGIIGWHQRSPLRHEEVAFDELPFDKGGKTYPPRPLQQAVVKLLEAIEEPILLLIEAPMGEGKTEAAFYAHVRLQQALGHRGMYVALPTRATGNAMFKRTVDFLEGVGRKGGVDLQLQHGVTLLNDDYNRLKIRAVDERGSADVGQSVSAQEWFSHKKRALLSEYGVGTVDQALLSVLPIKHNSVRLWGLGNRTVVIDEVHAYDTYTSSLIETLLAWLYALSSSAIVMSATLPASRRAALLRAYGAAEMPNEVAYPRVFKVSGGRLEPKPFEADPKRRVRLELRPCGTDISELVPQLLEGVREGGCVACIVNTVDRAQQLYLALRAEAQEDIQLELFHARYPAQQRQGIEDRVLGLFGKEGERPGKAILVGTQVLEQSLDLDFDQMFTDLAPLDLILQRAGRVHRHQRENRSSAQSVSILHTMGLAQETEVPTFDATPSNEKLYWNKVYAEDVLLRTYALLNGRAELSLPDDIDRLVEQTYSKDLPKNLSEAFVERIRSTSHEREEKCRDNLAKAAGAIIGSPFEAGWENVSNFEQYDPEDHPEKHKTLLAATRLGEPSVSVIPLNELEDGRFQCGSVTLDLEASLEGENFWKGKELFKHSLNLSRTDVVAAMWAEGRPKSWEKHPLLRNCYPLKLTDGWLQLPYTELELDPQLGLRYYKKGG